MGKIGHRLLLGCLALAFSCNGLSVQTAAALALFPRIAFENLHAWLPEVHDDAELAAAACPFIGKALPEAINRDLAARINSDLRWKLRDTDRLIAVGQFPLGEKLRALLIRLNGSDQFFDSSLTMFIMDGAGHFTAQTELAGYSQGDSGGVYFESWFTPAFGNGFPELVRRNHGFITPDADRPQMETERPDSFERLVWNGAEYESSRLSATGELEDRYSFAGQRAF